MLRPAREEPSLFPALVMLIHAAGSVLHARAAQPSTPPAVGQRPRRHSYNAEPVAAGGVRAT
jgi:hypothetical protein